MFKSFNAQGDFFISMNLYEHAHRNIATITKTKRMMFFI
ncbi:hypothetical protein HPHPP23_0057 [Helicobacter pylori Hp P-23]|uniref:Uncharacterized protein n=3 Tax=Helicobacter pylori TaxID=210 RepID=D7FD47_HELP3|nr:hypothetical protein HPNQ4216_0828 [Helicobacter pylori NQ4216]EJB48797.1 hypothetical protein HPHPH16_0963 [Helicobacter pylori Hp H-16]EJB65531.1 hypothetical protein HPHPH44_0924 [Helicobacter pylori Hp H-44]EJB79834.1 hypothetical protein HPHPH3_1061 [Helicobacter pylori Hp H-3]EJB89439.1 hypothetical protein HPHPH18_0928 [Helicobacter pylori Hp H-18]EJC06457.1 hypothetical protein HPHPP15_1653 [Helicobacter pylori Hp P-15]EJC13646.1 hypothetical protein HPHPP23_0057 [Helicobacter pylo